MRRTGQRPKAANAPSAKSRHPRSLSTFADATWTALGHNNAARRPTLFDLSTLEGLPEPAKRLLQRALPDRTPLHDTVRLSMRGEIKLAGRWFPFTADQILRAGKGFVWAPVVGGRLIRFVGADALGPDGARMEFRLHNRIPIVQASGPDIDRSAHGRLAAETVVWLPAVLTPQSGARWTPIDQYRATVAIDGPGGSIEVDVEVDDDGKMTSLGLQRWRDSATAAGFEPFGGTVDALFITPDGVRIAGRGAVGWEWGTPGAREGLFFRYEILEADFPI